jgi:hypothetical protein
MRPRIKLGLIIGAIGLVLNVCISTAMGLCGPFAALIAGALSGFFTARQEKLPTKSAGARAGVTSGLVAGALVFIGQLLGAVGALVYFQSTGSRSVFGQAVPNLSAGGTSALIYIVSAMGVGVCFGLVGMGLSAGAGALAAYLATSETAPLNPPGY